MGTAHPKISRARQFARRVHNRQMRLDGESQFAHCERVATIVIGLLAEFHHPVRDDEVVEDVVAAALLHDTLEDTETTDEELAGHFGERVARIVRAVSHEQEEEPDEVYLSRVAAGGREALLVKLADRLDNTRTLVRAPREFRERKLAEIRAALPIWERMFLESVPLIRKAIKEVEDAS